MVAPVRLAIIGGTGVNLEVLRAEENFPIDVQEVPLDEVAKVRCLWGKPSGLPQCLKIAAKNSPEACLGYVFLMKRHGVHHNIPPAAVNYRANIGMLKELGVTHILAFSAVGSLNPKMPVRSFAVVDQYLDYTQGRTDTFFDREGLVNHVNCYEPVDPLFTKAVTALLGTVDGLNFFPTATSVTINGPHFAPRAELRRYMNAGGDLIGMTTCTEAKLAKETGMRYCNIAMITDEAHNDGGAAVSHQEVERVMKDNAVFALKIIVKVLSDLPALVSSCPDIAVENINGGSMTSPGSFNELPPTEQEKYRLILGEYVPH